MMRRPDERLPRELRGASTQPRYNTAAVVRVTGVPAATFRAWERRYGYPSPQRQPGGQRLYSDRDIAAIRWLHQQTEQGLTISRAVAILRERGEEPAEQRPHNGLGRPAELIAIDLDAALLEADHARAHLILAEAFALYPFETVALEILEPLLVQIGERWSRGEITVAQEHFVTQYILRRLFGLFDAYDQLPSRGLILTACGPGELHEVGIVIVSLVLMRRGFRVVYLGPNLPLETLTSSIARLRPDLVCLSATTAETGRRLIGEARALAASTAQAPRLAFGGQAFAADPSLRDDLPGDYLGPDARAALERIEQVVESPRA